MGYKKQGAKKQDYCYSKREELTPYFGTFFKVPDPKKLSGRPNKLG